jgi:hypothetical protein
MARSISGIGPKLKRLPSLRMSAREGRADDSAQPDLIQLMTAVSGRLLRLPLMSGT